VAFALRAVADAVRTCVKKSPYHRVDSVTHQFVDCLVTAMETKGKKTSSKPMPQKLRPNDKKCEATQGTIAFLVQGAFRT
jgi:hypothetical protein